MKDQLGNIKKGADKANELKSEASDLMTDATGVASKVSDAQEKVSEGLQKANDVLTGETLISEEAAKLFQDVADNPEKLSQVRDMLDQAKQKIGQASQADGILSQALDQPLPIPEIPSDVQDAMNEASQRLSAPLGRQAESSDLLSSAMQAAGSIPDIQKKLGQAKDQVDALGSKGKAASDFLGQAGEGGNLPGAVQDLADKARETVDKALEIKAEADKAIEKAKDACDQAVEEFDNFFQNEEAAAKVQDAIDFCESLPDAEELVGEAKDKVDQFAALNQKASEYLDKAIELADKLKDPEALVNEAKEKLGDILGGNVAATAAIAGLLTAAEDLPFVGEYATQAKEKLEQARKQLDDAQEQISDALESAEDLPIVSDAVPGLGEPADNIHDRIGGLDEVTEDSVTDMAGADEEVSEEDAEGGDFWIYVTTPLDGDERKFLLAEIEGEEHLSGLFHYRLKLRTDDNSVDFTQIVGQPITVTVEQYNGTKRYINGVVFRFIQAGYDGNITTYYAEIRPWFWQLTLTSNSKIFQNMSVPEIIADVFSSFGLTDFEDRTTGTYNPRVYCVQYQETSFAYVSRLMEEEGIFYFFEHSEDTHMLVLADDADAHQACPGLEAARMRPVAHEDRSDDTLIDRCTLEQQMVPNKYASEDFNFETPQTDLLSSVDGKESGGFRIYDYPGKFGTTGDGEAIINKRIEAHELPQKLLRGQGFCRAFIAGYKFDLTEHDRDDMNVTYVLRNLFIRADQDGYSNVFEAFPGDVPFRPPLATKKPKVVGTQTAIVTGPAGEEIWPDEYGRVKVQFHWDEEGQRDENTSCWVRVTQMWAGKNWGTMFIPRIGMEVIVSFLEGDPDQPIITGTVYNASQVVPYSLPGDKTKSTMKTDSSLGGGGSNEIRFEDKKGSEEIFIHAQKDMNTTVKLGNQTNTVKEGTQSVTVKGDTTLVVQAGKRSVDVTGGDYSATSSDAVKLHGKGAGVSVTGDAAGVTVTGNGGTGVGITGKPNVEATGSAQVKLTAPAVEINASGGAKIMSPKVDIGNSVITISGSKIELSAGGSSIVIDGGGVTISTGGVITESASLIKHNG